ncbi:DnaJ-domain-containing protein [Ramicandelaber brevisporus]|nr:DnaJ-domain-containing protein [Ramicandelaber brevisporus]
MNLNAILDDLLQPGGSASSKQQELDKDLYAVLNCAPTASAEQIATEYKVLALRHHPDRQPQGSESSAVAEFQAIAHAYSILGDEEKKAKYDRWKKSGLRIPFASWLEICDTGMAVHWSKQTIKPTLTMGEQQQQEQEEGDSSGNNGNNGNSSGNNDVNADDNSQTKVEANTKSREASMSPSVGAHHKLPPAPPQRNDDLYAKFRNYEI